jgi:dihydrofolate reductase
VHQNKCGHGADAKPAPSLPQCARTPISLPSRRAAGGKNLEIVGADVAALCLRAGLVDEILVFVLPVLLGVGVRFFALK